jgi:hypothetical protein
MASRSQDMDHNMGYPQSGGHTTYLQQSQNALRHYLATQKVELPTLQTPATGTFSSHLQSTPTTKQRHGSKAPKLSAPSSSWDGNPTGGSSSQNTTKQSSRQEISVIQNPSPRTPQAGAAVTGRKGGRFRPGWLANYVWLQYDDRLNAMFCKYCRKWSGVVPDIRTSFAEGNSNFRLEIVNHHDKCKAHRLCVEKEEDSVNTIGIADAAQ